MIKHIHPKSVAEWREWLEKHHDKESRIFLVKYKRHTGKPTISHQESMDEAICFGWIDTIVKRLDDDRYVRGFARRNKNSRWSNATLSYARRLIKEGKMTPVGLKMFKEGLKKPTLDSGVSKFPDVPGDLLSALKKDAKAFSFFDSLAPSYRRFYIYRVVSAKRPETRLNRIKRVVEHCKNCVKLGM